MWHELKEEEEEEEQIAYRNRAGITEMEMEIELL